MKDLIMLLKATNKRKHGENIARLLIDTKTKEILFIPENINHPEFLAEKLNVSIDWFKKNPNKISHFIGAAIEIIDESISSILIGVSGLEALIREVKKPFHDKTQVNLARDILLELLIEEKMHFKEGYSLKVVYL